MELLETRTKGAVMFDTDTLIAECLDAVRTESDGGRRAVRDIVTRTVSQPSVVQDAIGRDNGGLDILYDSPELTVLNAIWAPGMSLYPHDHRMWAVIGIYGGTEDNTMYRRGLERIVASGGRALHESEVLSLGADAIHAVANPERRFTGAIHVYGGDFINQPRSQWDPDTLREQPYDIAQVRRLFAAANEAWAAQLGTDVDESAD
jgi:predicted metal-dependent enzyme (double-stranded beta helix superfamily)